MKKKYKIEGVAESQTLDHPAGLDSGCAMGGFVVIGLSPGETLDDLELMEYIRRQSRQSPVVMLAGNNSEKQVVAALKIGMNDYFEWPFTAEGIVERFRNYKKDATAGFAITEQDSDGFITGKNPVMKKIKNDLKKIALTNSNVLITGETGTGKDMAAEYIHRNSLRKSSPLLCVNCTAFPETLLESELFGYEKGTFTNALTARPGKFEMASGGTLFLDEIGDMGLGAQAKILRAIEKKEIWRIGGERPFLSDFRLITATNRDPEQLIGSGRFRDDLYYRLNIARVHLPPLRERKEDIGALTQHAIEVLNRKFNSRIRGVSDEVLALLTAYHWPGNIRQLNNVIEASFINSPLYTISYRDLPESFRKTVAPRLKNRSSEYDLIQNILIETGWNVSKAAEKMSVSRMTLYRKMARHHIRRA